jgi:hypothetical protein
MKWVILAMFAALLPATAHGRAQGLGVGVVLGEPVGLTVAYRPNERQSVQLMQGWSFGQKRMHMGLDYMHSVTEITSDDTLGLRYPVNVGIGLRGRLFGSGTVAAAERGSFGLRFPLSVGVEPDVFPLEVYFEMAPVWVVAPISHGGFDGGIGARVFF